MRDALQEIIRWNRRQEDIRGEYGDIQTQETFDMSKEIAEDNIIYEIQTRYDKSVVRAICQQGNAVHFFTGYEIHVHGERLWIALA